MGTAGLKLVDDPKDKSIVVRMDSVTVAMLESLAVDGKSKSRVIRDGIKLQYEQAQKKKKK